MTNSYRNNTDTKRVAIVVTGGGSAASEIVRLQQALENFPGYDVVNMDGTRDLVLIEEPCVFYANKAPSLTMINNYYDKLDYYPEMPINRAARRGNKSTKGRQYKQTVGKKPAQ